MNCPKCVIDGGKVAAAAGHLKNSARTWLKTIEELYDPTKTDVQLTDAEKAQIVAISQTWCDIADDINDNIKASNDALCAIAVAHSHSAP